MQGICGPAHSLLKCLAPLLNWERMWCVCVCVRALCANSWHHVSTAEERTELISSVQVACQFGMEESLQDIVTASRLRWLGHLGRMDDHRLPKKILFGWLPQRCPAHGTRVRWRDPCQKRFENV